MQQPERQRPRDHRPYRDLVDAIGNTPLVEIAGMSPHPKVRIFAKLEGHNPTGSVKDRVAKYMIASAEASGALSPDKIILEATSGNTGIALAMIGRRKGYRVKVVMPENTGQERCQLLQLYGAEIVFSPPDLGTNGSIEVAQRLALDDRYYMPYQYGNPANPLAHYETTGQEIVDDLPAVDIFVAGLGTGGTLMGVARRLKEHNPSVQIVAVEPNVGEVLQGLRSLEDGFIPPILDPAMLDRKLLVTNAQAIELTRALAQREGIFCGVSSGAAVCGAMRLAQKMDKGNIVVLLADGGWKYLSTGLWLKQARDLDEIVDSHLWW